MVIRRCKCRHVQASHHSGECYTCKKVSRFSGKDLSCTQFNEAYCSCRHADSGHDPYMGVCRAVKCACEGFSPADETDEYHRVAFVRAKRRAEVREKCGWHSPGSAPGVYVPYVRE